MTSTQHPYWFVIISFALALTPLLVGLFTSFMKIHIVLSFFRSGLGAQQVPGGLVLFGISVALTLSVMHPTLESFYSQLQKFPLEKLATTPQKVTQDEISNVLSPWKEFLTRHVGAREKEVFQEFVERPEVSMGNEEKVSQAGGELKWTVLLPAFIVTELKEAFLIGFVIMIPFLVIDLVVANILAGIGMFMVSPVMISLPLKIALFTFADGWLLLTTGIVQSYSIGGGI
ncbi:MAG: EscR/YscR/HrcR family type III secretion system export apparatus protein [Bdellovibrionota bacterium]|jgi:flagellar biosynthesis protein FliP